MGMDGRAATHGVAFEGTIANWGNAHPFAGRQSFKFQGNKNNSRHYTLTHNIGDERKLKHSHLEIQVATSYWDSNPDSVTDHVNDLESNTLKKTVYNVKDYSVLFQDRDTMMVAFDIPNDLDTMWSSNTWSEYVKPRANNDVRAYVRFVIRPTRQSG